MRIFFTFLCLLTISLGQPQSGVPAIIPEFVVSDSPPIAIPDGQDFTFGYLRVPENRSASETRTLELPVFWFKSRSSNPATDPIIYLVGGPGASIVPSAPYMKFYRYLEDRDLILLEQRGTRYARPSLDCPEWAAAVQASYRPDYSESQRDSLLVDAAASCRQRLVSEGADLEGYRTREIAADVADLRRVLGIEDYNLLTLSYGTKVAQVLMRDYPEGIRSVVMDSPLPLESHYDEESMDNLFQTVITILESCAADSGCNDRYPDLRIRFLGFLGQATQNPVPIPVQDLETGESVIFHFTGADFLSLLANASTDEFPMVPALAEAWISGDYGSIPPLVQYRLAPPGPGTAMGMRLSVWCAEESPFTSSDSLAAARERHPEIRGLSPGVFPPCVCEVWDVAPEGDLEDAAVQSDIPVLLISGQYDALTPPRWAAGLESHFSRSFHLVFPGWGHTPTTYWSNPCAMDAARAFIQNPLVEPGPPCFGNLGPVRFE